MRGPRTGSCSACSLSARSTAGGYRRTGRSPRQRTSPDCSPPTRTSGPICSGPGPTAPTESCPRTCAGSRAVWRRLRERIGSAEPGRAARRGLRDGCGSVPTPSTCPHRLSVFGPDPADPRPARRAGRAGRAPRRPPVAAASLAGAVGGRRAARRRARRLRAAARDGTARRPAHPLLASLGRDAASCSCCSPRSTPARTDHHHALTEPPATLLGRLQADLAADQPSAPASRLAADDRSVQVHACHGPPRQVEVLREVLLGLLADDPTLEPRDVLVMCPDIEAYAPLISATFGLGRSSGGPAVRAATPATGCGCGWPTGPCARPTRCSPPSPSCSTSPTAGSPPPRCSTWPPSPPVRRRFRFDDDDLERLRDWVAADRRALGARRRSTGRRSGLDELPQNTWETGLDRLLLGAAMAEDRRHGGCAGSAPRCRSTTSTPTTSTWPVGSPSCSTGSPSVLARLDGAQPLARWLTALDRRPRPAAARPTERDAWQQAQARRELADVADGRRRPGRHARRCGLDDLRALLADRLRGPPDPGELPHRQPDDVLDGADALGAAPGGLPARAGRRRVPAQRRRRRRRPARPRPAASASATPRSEDRQLLLDAVLAAEEHLVVLYTGADERTNARRPPAVPVGELLDALDRLLAAGRRTSAAATRSSIRHPLQPFDARNFTAGALGRGGPFSFDRPALARRPGRSRRAATGRRRSSPRRCRRRRAGRGRRSTTWSASSSTRCAGSCGSGSSCRSAQDEEEVADELPVELDGLTKWAVGDRLLGACCAAPTSPPCRQAEWRRGVLPPSALGQPRPRRRAARGRAAARRAAPTCARRSRGPSTSRSTCRTAGASAAPSAACTATTVVRVTYSRLGAKHRLRAWVQLLALAAARRRTPLDGGHRRPRPARGGRLPALDARPGRTRRRAAACSPSWSTCATAALREPLPLRGQDLARYARARAPATGPVAAAVRDAERDWTADKFAASRTTVSTSWSGASAPPLDVLLEHAAARATSATWCDETSRLRRARPPALDAAARRTRSWSRPVSTPTPPTGRRAVDAAGLRRLRPLPAGTAVLEASAGTGKTFTIAALATRYVAEGARRARPADARHVRPRRDPGAAGPGAGAAGQRRAGAAPTPRRRAAATTTWCGSSPTCPTTRSRSAGAGWPPRSPTSTPPPSPPRTASASRCSPGSAWRPTPTRTRPSSRTSPTWSTRSSTTSTSAVRHARRRAARLDTPRPRKVARAAVGDRQAGLEPADADRRRAAGQRYGFARRRPRRGRAPQAAAPAARLRRPAAPGSATRSPTPSTGEAARQRVRAATGSCWSTSSRTPTRCSGRSCGSPSTGTRRWC